MGSSLKAPAPVACWKTAPVPGNLGTGTVAALLSSLRGSHGTGQFAGAGRCLAQRDVAGDLSGQPPAGDRDGRDVDREAGRADLANDAEAGEADHGDYGGITPWLPLFMFVLLFGLSMDYHVFILSRIREMRLRSASMRDAVTGGIGQSAGVVTSAAVIMVTVFSIFATLSIFEFKVFGVAMPAAVLIDATIVRGVLLPAGLALIGDRVWSNRRHRRAAVPAPPSYSGHAQV